MLPVYILMKSDSVELVSKFMIVSIIGGLISQWPVGILSDKFGRRKLISITSFISVLLHFYLFYMLKKSCTFTHLVFV